MLAYSFDFADGEFLQHNGALIQVDITVPMKLQNYLAKCGLPAYSVRSGHALIDTGAGVSAVDESIFTDLEIPHVESELIHTPGGAGDFRVFNASASFPELSLHHVPLQRVLGCDIRGQAPAGYDLIMLLGRDILRDFVLTYDGPSSLLTIKVHT